MFSKELEELIEAAVADGVITEKTRAVLHKRAQAEGVDPDELDVVIDGRLSKMKKEATLHAATQTASANNSKYGVVRKCPNCGAPIAAGSVKCTECGFEFVGIEANNSVSKLSKMLQEIESSSESRNGWSEYRNLMFGTGKRVNQIRSTITNFPVPTTKEDLLEFILFLQPKSIPPKFGTTSDPAQQQLYSVYKSKYDECIGKAQLLFANDPMFQPLFEQYAANKKKWWRNLSLATKTLIITLLLLIALVTTVIALTS